MAQIEHTSEAMPNTSTELHNAIFRVVQEKYGNVDEADNRKELKALYESEKKHILESDLFTETVTPALRQGYTVIPYYPEESDVPFSGFLLKAPAHSGLEDIPVNFDDEWEGLYPEEDYTEAAQEMAQAKINSAAVTRAITEIAANPLPEEWKNAHNDFLNSSAVQEYIQQDPDNTDRAQIIIDAYIRNHSNNGEPDETDFQNHFDKVTQLLDESRRDGDKLKENMAEAMAELGRDLSEEEVAQVETHTATGQSY